jgi:transposase
MADGDEANDPELLEEFQVLRQENARLVAEVEFLRRKVAELERRLATSSQSSSMPPSSDSPAQRAEARKTRAERRAEDKRVRKETLRRRGKQPGAPGKYLARQQIPDVVKNHEPQRCVDCGESLTEGKEEGFFARQVFDTPDPRLICTEHRSIRRLCSCGQVSAGAFPPEAKAPVCYGPNVRAQTLYLLSAQHLSVERTAEAMSEMLGVEVSTGFVASLLPEAAGLLEHSGFIEHIKALLRSADVIHADETSDQVRTDTWYFHVVATSLYTYLFASPTRAKSAPDEAGVLGGFRGIMVHDRLKMYFSYRRARHAVCGAHLVRDLAAVAKVDSQRPWAQGMSELLLAMNAACNAARGAGRSRLGRRQLTAFLERYDAIIADGLSANPAPTHRGRDRLERDSFNLVMALKNLKSEATRFAKDLRVPFTNNEAERSLRMVKLHAKISSCFQSERHATSFAAIRSYIGTARKHDVGALSVLSMLFRHDTWMPPATT